MEVGPYTFTLKVTDHHGVFATKTFTWNVSRLLFQYTSLPVGANPLTHNQPYTQSLLVFGGSGHYTTWENLAAMPPGLSLDADTGIVSGTPLNAGSFNSIPIRVSDDAGNTLTANVDFNVSNTPAGTNVTSAPIDPVTGGQPVTLTFAEVTTAGTSYVTSSDAGPQPPATFTLIGNYYEISTTATVSWPVTVCFAYPVPLPAGYVEAELLLSHFDGAAWVPLTTSQDFTNHVICAATPSFSPFAVFGKAHQVVTAVATPSMLWPPNGKSVPVKVQGTISDAGDLASARFAVADEYGLVQPAGSITVASNGTYTITMSLVADRRGNDRDGRKYTIVVVATDKAGNEGSARTTVTVPHDRGK